VQKAEAKFHDRLVRQLDWNLLRTFIAIVQYGGISRAAEHVHLTQPAVSHALKRLEAQLRCKLIDRSARRFEITQAGHQVYQRAVEIHNQISNLQYTYGAFREDIFGHIRLLFASRLKSAELDDLIADFHRSYPMVTIRVDVMPSFEIQALIQQGAASFGFCLLKDDLPNLVSQRFMRQRYGLYCGRKHRLFEASAPSAEDMKNEDLITFPSDQLGGVLSPLMIYREQHNYRGRIAATSWNLDEIIRLVEIGMGIGLLPVHIASELVEASRLRRLPPDEGIGPIDVHLIWSRSAHLREAETAFLNLALKHVGKAADQNDEIAAT
jgi:DNA-binding transcriptional LysR family regulator